MLLSEQTIPDLLRKVLDVAVTAVEGVDAATVTVLSATDSGFATVSATDDSARSVDEVQYQGGGPCVAAAVESTEVRIELPDADQWARFSAAALSAGYHAVWSLPLAAGGSSVGSLNLYAGRTAPWLAGTGQTARLLGHQAEAVLASAMELARSEQLNVTLRRALETRTVIGQAQGVLMARQHIGSEEAFDILRRASQRTNRKVRDIAVEIVATVKGDQDPLE